MNKIVELIINMEEFEFEDLGVEILSLVDKPAIEVNWMAFSEEYALRENPDCPDGFEHQMPDGRTITIVLFLVIHNVSVYLIIIVNSIHILLSYGHSTKLLGSAMSILSATSSSRN